MEGAFQGLFVSHLSRRKFVHLPILLSIKGFHRINRQRRVKKIFRFEEMWTREASCEEVIKTAWENDGDINVKLVRTAGKLKTWSFSVALERKCRHVRMR